MDGVDQLAVADAVHASRGIDARDPEAAHVALAVAAVAIHVGHRAHDGFMRGPEESLARTTVALGHIQNFLMPLVCWDATFYFPPFESFHLQTSNELTN